jgi:hypothetical protein
MDNDYNRKIASRLLQNNRKEIMHEQKVSVNKHHEMVPNVGIQGGYCKCGGSMNFFTGKESMTTQKGVRDNGAGFKTGGIIKGMSGHATGTNKDLGFERVIGAGMSAGVKTYNKNQVLKLEGSGVSGGGASGGAKKPSKWLELVKKICKERHLTVKDAIQYIKSNNLYKK